MKLGMFGASGRIGKASVVEDGDCGHDNRRISTTCAPPPVDGMAVAAAVPSRRAD